MALYTALHEPEEEVASAPVPSTPTPKDDRVSQWHGILYGFKPTLMYVLAILAFVISLNIYWSRVGKLGFAKLGKMAAVQPSNLVRRPGWLLVIRVACFVATVLPLVFAVRSYRAKQLANGKNLFLWGLEILLVFCTLWTWCCMAGYFAVASLASSLYVVFGWAPGQITTSLMWIWFDIAFGMTWLVFWACWIFLIPGAWLAGHKTVVVELLSPAVLYMHNCNVVIMLLELLLSSWTVNIEHFVFPVYFGIVYVFFNWWLYSKIHVWIYFFLDYDRPLSVPACLALVFTVMVSFWSGAAVAGALGKA